jgi:RecB family endonuclease NucS
MGKMCSHNNRRDYPQQLSVNVHEEERYCWINLEQAHGLSSKAKEDELLHQTLAIHRMYIPGKSYKF